MPPQAMGFMPTNSHVSVQIRLIRSIRVLTTRTGDSGGRIRVTGCLTHAD
ncbi:hypothetical protein CYPRO_3125 [Cyclonatronum proteinivorum]|uniref:Uncharacterized protein n=1 Tax=Cyclonatronum proteinivorum TaxID=1457365 RepID=A0A345UPF8_9BACT|nr:hypothetical protein CYPRO_3125 [Cyclonatronum proteinivorum]